VTDEDLIGLALDMAAAPGLEMPIAAVVVGPDGAVLGTGVNRREEWHDPTAHAEMLALRDAGAALRDWRLTGCTLAVTLEPCTMCAGALVLARVRRLVFGAYDDKAGAVGGLWDVVRDPRLNHQVEVVGGVRAAECGAGLSSFFAERRVAGSPLLPEAGGTRHPEE
jgi:tRNA(adenine34) deaminase